MRSERCKRRVYGYHSRPHDGAGLFYSRGIYVDGSIDGNMHRRRPYAGLNGCVGAIGMDTLLR